LSGFFSNSSSVSADHLSIIWRGEIEENGALRVEFTNRIFNLESLRVTVFERTDCEGGAHATRVVLNVSDVNNPIDELEVRGGRDTYNFTGIDPGEDYGVLATGFEFKGKAHVSECIVATSGGNKQEDVENATFQIASPITGTPYDAMTTLPRIKVTGLVDGEKYKFTLTGEWDGLLNEVNGGRGKEFTASSNNIIILNICDNGEANRIDCEDEFDEGTYGIILTHKTKLGVLASVEFCVIACSSSGSDIDTVLVPGLESGDLKDNIAVSSGVASSFLSFGIGIGGGIAFLLMIFGAYRLMFAAGNPESVQQGQQIITAAIAGLLVIVFASFILRFLGLTILGLGGL